MDIKTNFIKGRMNKSVDERILPMGEYRDALNIRLGSTEGTTVGAIENTKGNTQLTTLEYNGSPLSSSAVCIGAYEDGSNETMYWFVHDSVTGVDMVVSYDDNINATVYHVVSTSVLNFNPQYVITGVDKIQNLLFWTDNLNPPRKINVNRQYPDPILGVDQVTEGDLSVIVAPPSSSPSIDLISVPQDSSNYMESRFICFSYRYKYRDGEYSALSQFSEPAFAPGAFSLSVGNYTNSGMSNIFNAVNVSFDTGGADVIGVDLCFKLADSNVINVIEKYIKQEQGWSDNSTQSILFDNSKIYTTLPESELLRLFDNVPRLAKAQTVMSNMLMYGNYVDGYDMIDASGNPVSVLISVTPESDIISSTELTTTISTGTAYNIDPATTVGPYASSAFVIDFSSITLTEGSVIRIVLEVSHHSFTSNITSSPSIPGAFSTSLTIVLGQDYASVYALASSVFFSDAVSTLTSSFYSNAETPSDTGISPDSWEKENRGISLLPQDFIITTTPTSSLIGLQPAAIQFENSGVPGEYLYEYYSVDYVSAYYTESTYNNSLHSNRDYEVGIVYMDEYSRSTTALVSLNNTAFFPASASDTKNYLQTEVSSLPPEWASKYKFVVKQSVANYEIVYSNLYFQDQTQGYWFRLEGQNATKFGVGDVLIVKADVSGPLQSLVEIEVLDIQSQPSNFISGPSATIISEPAGLYMKIVPTNFSVNTYGDIPPVVDNGEIGDARGSKLPARVAYPCHVDNPAGAPLYLQYDVPFGSQVSFDIRIYTASNIGGTDPQDYSFVKSYVANRDYENLYEFCIGENISFDNGVNTGSGTAASNTFIQTLGTYALPNNTPSFVLGVNQYQFLSDPATDGLYLSIVSGVAGNLLAFSRMDCHIIATRTMNTLVFETQPEEANSEIFYEGADSYDVVGGYHSGNVQDQTSSVPAIVNLDFFNCYAFGNGVESYKILDSIVGRSFGLGNRTNAVSQQDYKEAHRFASITYSGIFQEETNINKLNEFNLSLGNFKDLEKSFGSIQKLDARETDVLVLQEDKISYVLAGKNLLSDAAAGGAITSIPQVLGTQIARIEEYGISQNPESYAARGFNKYFTDTKRGALIKLTGMGPSEQLSVISLYGMRSWFRDRFNESPNTIKVGGYDPYMDEYVLSITDRELPVEPVSVECGSIIQGSDTSENLSYVLELGPSVGDFTIAWTVGLIAGDINVVITYDGSTYSSGPTSSNGSLVVPKTCSNPQTAEVLVAVTGGAANFVITNGCPEANPLTLVRVAVTSPQDGGSYVHNEFLWEACSTTSPISSSLVTFSRLSEYPLVSSYSSSTGNPGNGIYPVPSGTVTMRTNKIGFDDYNLDGNDRYRYLVTNTLYQNNEADVRALLSVSAPILPAASGTNLYEGSFTFLRPSGEDYLYLVWDYRDINQVDLYYGSSDEDACCTGVLGIYYIDTDSLATATGIWTNSLLTMVATDGFYQFGGQWRQVFGGVLISGIFPCPSCPSPEFTGAWTYENTNVLVGEINGSIVNSYTIDALSTPWPLTSGDSGSATPIVSGGSPVPSSSPTNAIQVNLIWTGAEPPAAEFFVRVLANGILIGYEQVFYGDFFVTLTLPFADSDNIDVEFYVT